MSVTTKIQWCDSTVNPTMGCEGCELWNPKAGVYKCYAGTLHKRFGGVSKGYSPTFKELTLWPGRMAEAAGWRNLTGTTRKDKPWLDGYGRLIFVSDMSDGLSSTVTFEYLKDEVIANVISPNGKNHYWPWLTKRPERMAEFSEYLRSQNIVWPDNLWAGTSITTQGTTSRITSLLKVGDANTIRFLSVEPQQKHLDLSPWLRQLDWVIQGGESGKDASPFQIEWAVNLMRQCQAAGVPYFLKQLGSKVFQEGQQLAFEDGHGGDWSEWPSHLRVREMPLGIQLSVGGSASSSIPRIELPIINGARDKSARAHLRQRKRV
jgi:protein gp37